MFAQDLATSIVDFLYPPLCLSCSVLLADRNEYICSSCLSDIRRIDRSSHAFGVIRGSICGDGIIDDLIAPFWFERKSPLQSVIHALKYQQIPQVGQYLGVRLGEAVREAGIGIASVVPVPLHRAKLREREYNQAEYIARGVSGLLSAPCRTDMVYRMVNTSTQTELTAAERRRNVDAAFALGTSPRCGLDGGSILLVDDVLTTGATIRSIASLLKHSGCPTVLAGVIAIAAREHR